MRTYVSPIGYSSTTVTRVLLSRGIEPDDCLILLRPAADRDDSKADEAINDIESMLAEIQPETSVTIERLPHDDFASAVLRCDEILDQVDGEVIANLSGGARDIYLPFVIAALVEPDRIDNALTFSDIDGKVREIDLPNLAASVSPTTLDTLRFIARKGDDDGLSIPEISSAMGIAKSTISRYISKLDAVDAVETWREGKRKYSAATLSGRLLLRREDRRSLDNDADADAGAETAEN